MKLQARKRIHYDSGPNMTPLVDIVMVILIFLMLAGSFGTVDHYLESDLPISAKGNGVKASDQGVIPTKFQILVSQDGPGWIAKAGNFAVVRSAQPGDVSEQAYHALEGQLARQFQNFKAAGIDPQNVQVVIYPRPNVTLDALIPCFEASQDAGFKKVGFGVNPQ